MDKKDHIYRLIENNGGYTTYSEIKDAGLPYSALSKMIANQELEKDEPGIYRLPDVYIDDYYAMQYRFPKGIFSLETALWLHGLTLTIPFEPVMSFPFGTNTKTIKDVGIKPIILRNNYDVGVVSVSTPGGQAVRAYEPERTLVECLRPVYKIDIQIIAPAFKAYAEKGKINYSKLHKYAGIFKVEKKVQSYLEVLDFF